MLEEKIIQLNSSIIELTSIMLKLVNIMTKKEPAKHQTPEHQTPEQVDKQEISLSHDEVSQLCLTYVRQNKDNVNKIKAILSKYKAEMIKDIPAEKLPEFITELKKLETV